MRRLVGLAEECDERGLSRRDRMTLAAGGPAFLDIVAAGLRPAAMDLPGDVPPGHVVQRFNDRHRHMAVPPDSPPAFGDMVGFGKGRVIHLADGDDPVRSRIRACS